MKNLSLNLYLVRGQCLLTLLFYPLLLTFKFGIMPKNLFTSVKLVRPRSSKFDLSHTHTTTCNMGTLIPIFNRACIPGDRWKCGQNALLRLAPLVGPMYHLVHMFFHSFFVPYRILWPHFEDAITNTEVGGTVPPLPYIDINGKTEKIIQYMGIAGPEISATASPRLVSPFMLAAYQKIWMDYYRDENLQSKFTIELTDGDNSGNIANLLGLRKRNWEKDYFTSALATPQKGDAIDLPIGNLSADVPVKIDSAGFANTTVTGAPANFVIQADAKVGAFGDDVFAQTSGLALDPVTIRDLRRAMALQRFLERQNVGGTRYNEQVWAQFGIDTGDARLNRPEYIGGSKTSIKISEVLQTSESGATPQGNMAGHGIAVANGGYSDYFVKEHGCIITMMSVMPKTGYFRGMDREQLKVNDMFDFFWPELEHIGEQEIFNRELNANHATPNGTFGYTPRFAEYKHAMNRISGDMMSSLLSWNMARDIGTAAALNSSFVTADPTLRVFAVTDPAVDHCWVQILNDVKVRRMMSMYSTPV